MWCINGFVNAACWSPGISLLAQWWPRRERGQALGIVGMAAGAVDITGRHMAGTASGLLDAHGYFYAGLQSVVFGVLLNMSGSPWPLVFLLMAGTRVLCGVLIFFVKA